MGGGWSLDGETDPGDTEEEINDNQRKEVQETEKTTVAQEQQQQQQQQLQQLQPHNYEAIVKDADDSIIDKSADLDVYAGIFLNQKKKKYWIDKNSKNCFMVYPRDLTIIWGQDNRYWKWLPFEETGDGDAAELLNVCWLEVRGKFDTTKLSPGTLYQVVFKVMIKAASYGWEIPVTVGLKVPYGNNQETKVSLMRKERGKFIDIPVGEFSVSPGKVGDIEFSMVECKGGQWKRGLVIKGVVIQPKN